MSELPIVIVSHNRAGAITTTRLFDTGYPIISVAESQVDAYREADPDARYDVHPDSVRGLVQKRQYLYQKFGDLFMVDDDVLSVVDYTIPPGKPNKVSGDQLVAVIHNLARIAEQMDIMLYGFPIGGNPLHYQPTKPFALNGRFYGGHMGMRKQGQENLYYPSDIMTGEDDWIVCLNAYYYRLHVIDTRYGFVGKPMYKTEGGVAEFRTGNQVPEMVRFLQNHFGSDIVQLRNGRPNVTLPW